ncbi:MAG: hypothetical protein M3336_02130 [Chloroflexota bacterium]|nr:hypothetical protein [Chloroflexota bacterium]
MVRLHRVLLAAIVALASLSSTATSAALPLAQSQCFSETGFCIDEPAFQQYFAGRGGARILGFPVSRTFRLEGFSVQFFQRVVLQLQGGGTVARLNLLDPGILPVTRANQSVFPPPDPSLASEAPRPDDPAYATRVVDYIRAVSPDTWNGLPVGFSGLFNSTVPAQGVSPEVRTLLNLEIWGLPTSRPAFDPGNSGFVYQRFQRGIMHFRSDCVCTEGILVGDYLKAVLTGRDLPPDLADDMRGSRFFAQYAPGASGWIARPAELANSDLTAAFEPGSGPPQVPVAETPAPVITPVGPAPAVTTASLSGRVNPALAGSRVMLLPLAIEAAVDATGAFQVADLPPGEHSAYAVAPTGQVSDAYRLTLTAGEARQLDIELAPFKAGSPAVYIGRVVSASGSPVNNAVVWRLGGAGRTSSESDGSFRLVDAFGDLQGHQSPHKVTFVAMSADRWGWLTVDFERSPSQSFDVRLNQQGRSPTPPRRVYDVREATPRLRGSPHQFQAREGDYFTAFWADENNQVGSVEIKPDGGNLASVQSQDCLGACSGYKGNIRVIRLPSQGSFTLGLPADVDPAKVNWREAQVVAYR